MRSVAVDDRMPYHRTPTFRPSHRLRPPSRFLVHWVTRDSRCCLVLVERRPQFATDVVAQVRLEEVAKLHWRVEVVLRPRPTKKVTGRERLSGAAMDRVTRRCHILETTGESHRLQDTKLEVGDLSDSTYR